MMISLALDQHQLKVLSVEKRLPVIENFLLVAGSSKENKSPDQSCRAQFYRKSTETWVAQSNWS
jgi:hypothetical protein